MTYEELFNMVDSILISDTRDDRASELVEFPDGSCTAILKSNDGPVRISLSISFDNTAQLSFWHADINDCQAANSFYSKDEEVFTFLDQILKTFEK